MRKASFDEEDRKLLKKIGKKVIQKRVNAIEAAFVECPFGSDTPNRQSWEKIDKEYAIRWLLTSAMHWAELSGIDFKSCLASANGEYSSERFAANWEPPQVPHTMTS